MTACYLRRVRARVNAAGRPVLVPMGATGLNSDEITTARVLRQRLATCG
jgi:hypothetical protein